MAPEIVLIHLALPIHSVDARQRHTLVTMTESAPSPTPSRPHWAIRLLRLLAVFAIAAVIGGLATNYAFHRVRLWAADGVTCARYLPDGGAERLYGADCEQ